MDRGLRQYPQIIGVDLGGGKGRNTAVALLGRDEGGVRVLFCSARAEEGIPFYDEPLLRFIQAHPGALLAVDAPLRPTVCLRCRLERCPTRARCPDPVVRWFRRRGDPLVRAASRRSSKPPTTQYTQRACEVLLHREQGILPRETLGQGMGPLTARAHYLHRALAGRFTLNRDLLEVYPKATLHQLSGPDQARGYKRGVDTWRVRAEILEGLAHRLQFDVWREVCLTNDHCFDAVIAAYTGYLFCEEGWQLPEEDREVYEQDGWIWYPPKPAEGAATKTEL